MVANLLGLGLGLGVGDLVDDQTHTALGDHVGGAVADLDQHHSLGAGHSEHGHQVDHGVGAPGDHGPHAGGVHLGGHGGVGLGVDGVLQANGQGVHNEQEGHHAGEPEHEAGSHLGGVQDQLTGVAKDDHQGGQHAQLLALLVGLLGGQLHHQHDLDQQQGHGQQPVHVAVGVVEWHAGGGGVADGAIGGLGELVGLNPGVEDADVVVGGDEGHQAGDGQGRLVLLGNGGQAQPQEDGGGHHGGQGKAGEVVDNVKLTSGHRESLMVHHGGSGF